MNTSVPWSIKDISFESREAAKDAARRAGVSLGEWLDTIIAERAQGLGVSKAKVDNQERLDAVAAELSRLAGRQPGLDMGFQEDEAYRATGTDGMMSSPRPQPSSRPSNDPLRIMSERLADFERRASSRAADRASKLDNGPVAPPTVERPVKAGRAMNPAIRNAVAAISRRQAALEEDTEDLDPPSKARVTDAGDDHHARRRHQPGFDEMPKRDEPALAVRDVTIDVVPVPESRGPGGEPPGQARLQSRNPPAPASMVETAAALEDLKQDLRQAIKDIDPRSSVAELDRHIHDMERKIEGIGAIFPPGAVLSEIGERTREMRDLMAEAAARPPETAAMQRQVADLHSRMGELTALQHSAANESHGWNEVRAMLGRVASGSTVETLDRRIQDLAAKIDAGVGDTSPSPLLEDLSRRIDEIQASIKVPRESAVDTRPIEALVRGIAERIEDARLATASNAQLERLMGALANKIETGQSPVDMQALETQISRLGNRLERSEASLSTLDTVEHTLGELFSQLEETRHAAIDAAENAARTAARDTLRAAMQNQPAPDRSPDIIEQVGHILTEVRQHHDASDRHTQSTLKDLHLTMEKLVDHLAKLDVAGRSEAPSTVREPMPPPAQPRDRRRPDEAAAPSIQADAGPEERFRAERVNRRAARADETVDSLIEPGAGRSFRDGSVEDAPAGRRAPPVPGEPAAGPAREVEGPASYTAAARRAAQAAQASAAVYKQPKPKTVQGSSLPRLSGGAPVLERARQFLAQRRRPILLSLAGLVLLLGALEVVKVGFEEASGSGRRGAAETAMAAPPGMAEPAAPAEQDSADAASAKAPIVADTKAPAKVEAGLGKHVAVVDPAPANTDTRGGGPKAAGPGPSSNPFLAGLSAPSEGSSEGLRKVAASGDSAAQYELALRYAEGRTLNRDPKAAASWFEKAAAQGLAPAQYRIGSAYEKGIGVSRDPALAMAWYERAANAGNIKAMHNLAVMAADGSVGKSDYAKAAAWFSKAASLGVRDSQFNLAILCAKGLGIEQSLAKSYTWFAIAASQGDDDAGKKRDEVGTKLDSASLAAAKDAADTFRPAQAISAANDVSPPPGGWDSVAPAPKAAPALPKGTAPKVTTM